MSEPLECPLRQPWRALLIFFSLKNTTTEMCSDEMRNHSKVLSPKVFCLLVVVEVDCYSLNGLATVVLELNTWPKLSELINQWEARTGRGDQWQSLLGVTSASTFDCSESRAGNYQPWGTGGVSGCLSWNKKQRNRGKSQNIFKHDMHDMGAGARTLCDDVSDPK